MTTETTITLRGGNRPFKLLEAWAFELRGVDTSTSLWLDYVAFAMRTR